MWAFKRLVLLVFILAMPMFFGQSVETPVDDSLLRLHVRANSDLPEDQELKILVRDAVLDVLDDHLDRFSSMQAAQASINDALVDVVAAATQTVNNAGYDYNVSATLGQAQFPTRMYGDKVYRAGTYQALQIELGSAKGQNWWCVLFPPLCFVEVSDERTVPVVAEAVVAEAKETAPLRPKSRLVEWWQRLFSRVA